MKAPNALKSNRSSILGIIGVGAATGAFVGVAAVVTYGLLATKSTAAILAARTAAVGALGGAAAGLGMRRKHRHAERILDDKEGQLHAQEEEITQLKSEIAAFKKEPGPTGK